MPKFTKETAAQAGRKSSRKGTINAETRNLRAVVTALLEEHAESFADDLRALEAKDRLNVLVKLLEFVLPKLNRTQTELSGPGGVGMETMIRFVDDSGDDGYFDQYIAPAAHQAQGERTEKAIQPDPAPRPMPPLPPISKDEPDAHGGVFWL